MLRCSEGHFYDSAKHTACPWCALPAEDTAGNVGGEGRTKAIRSPQPATRLSDAGITYRMDRTPQGIQPVVGWLVCVDGPERGRDFRLHSEKNFVGRDAGMDIPIPGDPAISRQRHAIVTYEPKKRTFWLQPGDATGLVYCNENVVNSPIELHPDDIVELGGTKLVLVPFAAERFDW